jgi:hypothetical protein
MAITDDEMAEAVIDGLAMKCTGVIGEVVSSSGSRLMFCGGELYDLPARPRPFTAGNYKRGRVCRRCGASQWEDPNWYEPN